MLNVSEVLQKSEEYGGVAKLKGYDIFKAWKQVNAHLNISNPELKQKARRKFIQGFSHVQNIAS